MLFQRPWCKLVLWFAATMRNSLAWQSFLVLSSFSSRGEALLCCLACHASQAVCLLSFWACCSVGTVLFTALGISCAAIGLHGAFRQPDDLFTDEAEVFHQFACTCACMGLPRSYLSLTVLERGHKLNCFRQEHGAKSFCMSCSKHQAIWQNMQQHLMLHLHCAF